MADKEKIREEIERLLNKEWKWQSSTEAKFRCEAYKELLEFIDSLPEESASVDLEEAARKAATWYSKVKGEQFFWNDYHKFIAGANWQKQQLINKACEFFYHRMNDVGDVEFGDIEGFIEDFKKVLED